MKILFVFLYVVFVLCFFLSSCISIANGSDVQLLKNIGVNRSRKGAKKFTKWLKKNGFVLHTNAEIKYDKTKGMHGVTTGEIAEEEEIIRSPSNMLIPPSIPKQRSKLRQFTEKERLILRLIYEVRKGKKSKWNTYFSILPTINDLLHPIFWISKEVQYLSGSYAYHHLMAKLKHFNAFYDKVVQAKLFSPFVEMEELKWATCIVDSRAFTIKKIKGKHRLNNKPFLAPLADILNHHTETKVGWKLGAVDAKPTDNDGDNNNKDQKTYFRIFALNPYPNPNGGEELVNNYNNELTSVALLMNYGFVHMNPSRIDHLPLQIDIPKDVALYEERQLIREFMNISSSLLMYWNKPIPEKLIELVLIIQMDEAEVKRSLDEEKIVVIESEEHLHNAYTLLKGTFANLKSGYSGVFTKWESDDEDEFDVKQRRRIMYAKRVVSHEIKVIDYHIENINRMIASGQNDEDTSNSDL
jgi:hypothetical protein